MIEIQNLTKQFGSVHAVRDLSFAVDKGEIVGFLGPNGAGKSTTMRILTGFTSATAGTAKIAGYNVADDPIEVKRRVGYLPESVPLYLEMLTRSFLAYVAEVKGVSRAGRRREVDRVMERVGLTDMATRRIGHLSRGYRQRVGLAQALIASPPVLILDEPTVGLDPRQIIDIRALIKELAEEHTILLSTHILPEVQMLCKRVIIIHRGRIVAEDTMANLSAEPGRIVLLVKIHGDLAQAEAALKAAPGAIAAERLRGGEFRVTVHQGATAQEDVAKAVVQAGLGLRGLEEAARTLEDVFVEAISREDEDAA